MTKIRKQSRRKKFNYGVNRRKLRDRERKKMGKVHCKELATEWEKHRSVKTNLRCMGLSYDPNTTLKIPTSKEVLKQKHPLNEEPKPVPKRQPRKIHVAEALEADARAPREKLFRLPNNEVEWVTYLMDKYGKDYKAMAIDKKNYYQQTWKQIRAKIKRFKSIPEQYSVYLESRNKMETDESDVSSDGEL